jgi:hypothetical protein
VEGGRANEVREPLQGIRFEHQADANASG